MAPPPLSPLWGAGVCADAQATRAQARISARNTAIALMRCEPSGHWPGLSFSRPTGLADGLALQEEPLRPEGPGTRPIRPDGCSRARRFPRSPALGTTGDSAGFWTGAAV